MGHWEQVGGAGEWRRTIASTVLRDKLYTVENSGVLYVTDLAIGKWNPIGKPEFHATKFMVSAGPDLYTFEESGNLYRIKARPGLKIGEWDWCAHEMERVWQTQGAGLSRGLHSRKIVGATATRAAILDGLQWLEQKAGPDELVVRYLGAHGNTDSRTGWSMQTADLDRLRGTEVKRALARVQSRALVFIETCQSGGGAIAHPPGDPPVPPNVTAFCVCTATESTGNPLVIAVTEALYGRADFNRDDLIDLDELIHYVERRYRERWPEPGEGSKTPVIARSPQMSDPLALTRPSKALSAVVVKRQFHSALNEGPQGDLIKIRVLGWSNRPGDGYFIADAAAHLGQISVTLGK